MYHRPLQWGRQKAFQCLFVTPFPQRTLHRRRDRSQFCLESIHFFRLINIAQVFNAFHESCFGSIQALEHVVAGVPFHHWKEEDHKCSST